MDSLAQRMAACIEVIREWMSQNKLRLNSSNTEIIWLGSNKRLTKCSTHTLLISGIIVQPASANLGIIFDSAMSFSDQDSRLVGRCYYYLRQMHGVRRSLAVDSCHALVRALILSRLDYCNSQLSGTIGLLISQLDGVMRSASRVVLQLPRRSRITSAMYPRSTALVGCILANPVQTLCSGSTLPTWIGAALPPSFNHSDLRPSISCSFAVLCLW